MAQKMGAILTSAEFIENKGQKGGLESSLGQKGQSKEKALLGRGRPKTGKSKAHGGNEANGQGKEQNEQGGAKEGEGEGRGGELEDGAEQQEKEGIGQQFPNQPEAILLHSGLQVYLNHYRANECQMHFYF